MRYGNSVDVEPTHKGLRRKLQPNRSSGCHRVSDKITKALFMPIFNLLFYLVFRSKRNFCVKKIDRLGSLEDEENKSSRGKLGDISETDPFQNLQLIDFKDLSSEEISCKKN
ncbi:MAG: hypothetical protein K9L82_16760 [Chromatiaceae bacterium]|nr:hypothetical protein [Chromatiaceae bacterium]